VTTGLDRNPSSASAGIPPESVVNIMKQYRMIAYGAVMLLLLTLALSSAGCGTKQSSPAPSINGLKPQSTNVIPNQKITNPGMVAAHLESLARGVKGVKGANCVVFGNYAIVGIDVDPKMQRSRVGTIKYTVAEAFRKDPYGVNAIVTADIDMAQRLREIRAAIQQGRPLAGFAEELSAIIGRVVPQIPRNIIPPTPPENTGTGPLK
jgi:YhcN/YlaJ family sporulation lipoprotein